MSRKNEKNVTYRKMWDLLTELRGKIDGWDFKNYSLTMIFYKFFCEDFERKINEEQEEEDFEYRNLDDTVAEAAKTEIIGLTGVFIKPSELFCNLVKDAKKNPNLNIQIKNAFSNLQASSIGTPVEDNIKGIFDDFDVASSKLGNNVTEKNNTLAGLMINIDGLSFDKHHSKLKTDSFGDMYEYLMGMYAQNAGKSGGEYFTPSEASILNARVTMIGKKKVKNVYDPACGSGSLLLKAADVIGLNNITKGFYGQELNNTTYNLCRENMLLHNIPSEKIHIFNGDTLANPAFEDEKFDVIVSNPPYSTKWETNALTIQDERFAPTGVLAPENKADYAFVMHTLSKLSPTGTAGIVLPHGVLFRGGNEGIIRKYLIENNHIETIIGLPANIFFGTGIPTIIIVLKKERTSSDILFVDASKCFEKDKNQNVLRDMDIEKIFNAVKDRKDIKNFARVVAKSEIVANDYNLNIPRYVSSDEEDILKDLYSIMSSKISKKEIATFDKYLEENFTELFDKLFEKDKTFENYYTMKEVDIKDVVNSDDQVVKFREDLYAYVEDYKKILIKKFIEKMNEFNNETYDEIKFEINKIFSQSDLIDVYEVFQIIADNISEIESDIALLQENGMEYAKNVEPNIVTKKKDKKTIDIVEGNKGSIIPFDIVKKKYLTKDFEEIEKLSNDAATQNGIYTSVLEELDEDTKMEVCKTNNEGELDTENLAFDVKKLKTFLKKEVNSELEKANKAIEEEKKINKKVKELTTLLDSKAENKLKSLTDEEVIDCLVEKWINPIINGTARNLHSIVDDFIKKLETLNTKYTRTLSGIQKEIEDTDKEILSFLDDLTGSDSDMEAIKLLKDVLK